MKAVVSLSGGMDSATLLASVLAKGYEALCIGFQYPSKHNRWEQDAAIRVAAHYKVPFRWVDLMTVFRGFTSHLLTTGGPIPEGHYADDNMRLTVVPARNIVFCSVLAGIAWNEGAGDVFIGVHAGDHAIYSDCRPQFVCDMRNAIHSGTDKRVNLQAPFLHVDKAEILRRGLELGVPYGLTRTCYTSDAVACGRCGSCTERRLAFAACGVLDPVPYQHTDPLLTAPEHQSP